MSPSFFLAIMMGAAHSLLSTCSNSPSSTCVQRVSSTFSRSANGTGLLLQNCGDAPSFSFTSALRPSSRPRPSFVTSGFCGSILLCAMCALLGLLWIWRTGASANLVAGCTTSPDPVEVTADPHSPLQQIALPPVGSHA